MVCPCYIFNFDMEYPTPKEPLDFFDGVNDDEIVSVVLREEIETIKRCLSPFITIVSYLFKKC